MEGELINPTPTVVASTAARGGHTLAERIYDLIRDIRDPEHPHSLEELSVVTLDSVEVKEPRAGARYGRVNVTFVPTVPHCSLASVIGLSIVRKVREARLLFGPQGLDNKPYYKLAVRCADDAHQHATDITRQLADKERVAAALENPKIADLLRQCVDYLPLSML